MEHEQSVAKCQEEDPGGASTASAWEVCTEFQLTPLPLTAAGLCTKPLGGERPWRRYILLLELLRIFRRGFSVDSDVFFSLEERSFP